MEKQQAFLLACILLVLARGTGRAEEPKTAEPQYKGKPLSTWLTALKDKDAKVRVQAIQAMQSFGPRAKAAIPHLIPMLKVREQNIAHFAIDALQAIGAEAVPALIDTTKSKEKGSDGYWLRGNALGVLAAIRPKVQSALPALVQATKHADPRTRMTAVSLLPEFAPDAPKALDAVIRALEDEDQSVYSQAACALTYFGPEIRKALPVVARMMKSKDRERRGRAIGVLSSIAHKHREFREATPLLIAAWKDEDWNGRYSVVVILGLVRAEAKEAVPVLLEALKDPSKDMQAAAQSSLRDIDPERVEQFRVTSPVARIKDPQKQARAALKLLLESTNYGDELRLLPKQLRHTLSPTARKTLIGILLANLTSRRELQLGNLAPTTILGRNMRSYGFSGHFLFQDLFLENGRCAWALEGLLHRRLPNFNQEVNRDPKTLKMHIAQATVEAIEATLAAENPRLPWCAFLPPPLFYFHGELP